MLNLIEVLFVVIHEVMKDVTGSGVVLIFTVLWFFFRLKVEVFLPYFWNILNFSRFDHNINLRFPGIFEIFKFLLLLVEVFNNLLKAILKLLL